jgi:hypothetical protein
MVEYEYHLNDLGPRRPRDGDQSKGSQVIEKIRIRDEESFRRSFVETEKKRETQGRLPIVVGRAKTQGAV